MTIFVMHNAVIFRRWTGRRD